MTHRRRSLFGALFLVLTAVAAVALLNALRPANPSDEPMPTSGVLDGREFIAWDVVGRKLLPATQLQLSFENGQFSTSSGCNTATGGYAVRDGRLQLIRTLETLAGCAGLAQDAWVLDVIDDAEVSLSGRRLALRSGDRSITFVRRPDTDAPRAIIGQPWQLVRFTVDGRSRTLGPRPSDSEGPALHLSERVAETFTGCRIARFDVRYGLRSVAFGPPQAKRVPRRIAARCTGSRARVDATMRTVLRGKTTVVRRGNRLTVSRGTTQLEFGDAMSR